MSEENITTAVQSTEEDLYRPNFVENNNDENIEINESSSSDYDSDENLSNKSQSSKDRSSLLDNRQKKLKLVRLSYHPDSAIRKKSSIFYFEIHGVVKNMIDKKYLYEKLCCFDVYWKRNHYLSKPKTLVIDLRTSCLEYLEEQNVKELYSVQDIAYIYLDFDTQIASEILDIYVDQILNFQFFIKHYQMKKPKMNIKSFEDRDLIFHGLCFEEFNDKVAAWQWAKKFEKKSYANDFFYQRFKSKFNLDAVIERIRRPKPDYQCLRPLIQLKMFGNFYDLVVKWFNKRVTRGFEHKNKQIFIYGKANRGKSYIINAIFGGLDHQKFVLRQNDKNFILDGWDPYKYSHIICDEVNLENFDQEIYKLITEGAQISANRKNEKASTVACRVPMIFIANKKPKRYPGLYERLEFVKADKFVKILNINEYLQYDWSIPENELRCQPNPDLMPVFKCLNVLPPNTSHDSYHDSALDMTPVSMSSSSVLNDNILSKKKKMSCSSSSGDENKEDDDDFVQRPNKAKTFKRFFEDDDDDSNTKNCEKSDFGCLTLNDILNGSYSSNQSQEIFSTLDKISKLFQLKTNENSKTISELVCDPISPSQKKLTSFFKPRAVSSCNASCDSLQLESSELGESLGHDNENQMEKSDKVDDDEKSSKEVESESEKTKSVSTNKSQIFIMPRLTRSSSKKTNNNQA